MGIRRVLKPFLAFFTVGSVVETYGTDYIKRLIG